MPEQNSEPDPDASAHTGDDARSSEPPESAGAPSPSDWLPPTYPPPGGLAPPGNDPPAGGSSTVGTDKSASGGATEGDDVRVDVAATDGMKTCPECAEEIKAAAVVCRYCGHRFAAKTAFDQPREPGWYPDPDRPGYKRFYDEHGWTTRSVLDDPTGAGQQRSWQPPTVTSQHPVGISRTSGLAVAAFVCSLIGLWIAGIPMGYTARREIDYSRGTLEGRGYATAAIILGWIGVVATILIIIAVISAASQAVCYDDYGYTVPCE